MICSFEDMFKHALEKNFKYAVLLTEYCFDCKGGTPYIIYIPKALRMLENQKTPLNFEHKYYFYEKVAAGYYMDKASDNIIMFYTDKDNGRYSIKKIVNVYHRWQYVLDVVNEKAEKKERIKNVLTK